MTSAALIQVVIIYCVLHSVMAEPAIMGTVYKKWWYRAAYVVLSLVLLFPILYIYWVAPKNPFFNPPTAVKYVLYIIWMAALCFGAYTAKSYNNSHFLGIEQIKNHFRGIADEEPKKVLKKSGALAIVRHPYYFAGLVLVWARPMNLQDFYITLIFTAYFIIGIFNEERKLAVEFGDAYTQYKKEVPALIPFLRFRNGR